MTKNHSGKEGQELMHSRNLEAGANAVANVTCSICFLIESVITNTEWYRPQWAGAGRGRALPRQSLIKKMSYRLSYSLILQRYFLN